VESKKKACRRSISSSLSGQIRGLGDERRLAFMPNLKAKRPNALKHGAFAKTAILRGEDPEEFQDLHSALVEE
jgi:hypothetical protein